MNVEKRILELIELLAEYLQKTDRLLDRMDKHDILFEKQFARMDLAYQVIVTHSERIEILQDQTKDIQLQTKDLKQQTKDIQQQTKDFQLQMKDLHPQTNDLQHQTKELYQQTKELQLQTKEIYKEIKVLQLETKEIQQRNDSTFKEILSISKRVQTIEGEQ